MMRPTWRQYGLVLLLFFGLTAASCSSGDDTAGSDGTSAETTNTSDSAAASATSTTAALEARATHRDVGPFGVGVVTLTLPTGNAVEVYYPSDAVEPNGGLESYNVSDFLPEEVRSGLPDDADDEFKVPAEREVAPADAGPFPLVVFSHGFSGFRLQSTHLLTHLASWGMVVASPDHPSRNLAKQINEFLGATPETEPQSATDDVRATIELVRNESASGDGILAGIVEPDLVAVGGHSAGGFTALDAAASIDGMLGYVSYASGASSSGDQADNKAELKLPDVPSLFMAGVNDTIIEPSRTEEAHEQAPAPSWLWEIADSGHLAFSDLCAIGAGDGGIIGLADAIGFEVPDNLRPLAEDGCLEPNAEVRTVWPAIDHASVAFYRFVFGIDDEPVGLGPATAEAFDFGVTINEKTGDEG